MRRRFLLIIAVLTYLRPDALPAQPAVLDFGRISTADGLSQDIVTCLLRDRDGFLWIGTEDGLNLYDGYEIRNYRHVRGDSTSLGDNWISSLAEAPSGEIYVATMRGMYVYRKSTDGFRPAPGAFAAHADDPFHGLRAAPNGDLWVVAETGLILHCRPDGSLVARYPLFAHGTLSAHSIVFDAKGRAIVGADSALVVIDGTSPPRWLPLTERTRQGARRLDANALLERRPGEFWIGTHDGLFSYREEDGAMTLVPMERDHFFDLATDRSGLLWAAGFGGLSCYDPATGRSAVYRDLRVSTLDPVPPRIYAVLVDPSELLWVGSWHGGLWKANLHNAQFGLQRHSIRTPFAGGASGVSAIYEDRRGRLWFGNPEHGITIVDTAVSSHRQLTATSSPALSGNRISAMAADSLGGVWIASAQSVLDRYDERTGAITRVRLPGAGASPASILALCADRRNGLWIATEAAGVYRYDIPARRFVAYGTDRKDPATPPIRSAWSFLVDRADNVWIAGWTGDHVLHRLDGATGSVSAFDSAGLHSVRAMVEVGDGTLWTASWGEGVTHFDPKRGVLRNYRDADGLPSNYVKGILQAGADAFWISTERGLCVLHPSSGEVRRYDVTDGLQGNFYYSGACLRGSDGRLYFGGTEGVNGFWPDRIQASGYVAPVALTGLRVAGERERYLRWPAAMGTVEVNSRENALGFEYVGIDLRSPARNRYAYMLEGFDRAWVDAGARRYATYTDLEPGTYVFRVRGTNSEGIWNPTPASVRLVVLPAYWQTWWFRGGLAALFAALLWGFYRYRVRRLLELERTRAAIATDLHDDIGASLTSIALYSDLAKRDIAAGSPDAVRRLELIAQTSRTLLDSMNDIVWSINPENDALERTILRMEDYAVALLAEQGIDLHVSVPEQLRSRALPMAVRRNLFLIFKESLGNVLKHAGATAVEVAIATMEVPGKGEGIRLTIRDNGKGFSAGAGRSGNGLRNIAARARALGGEAAVESTPGAGTSVEVRVPLKSPM